MTDSHGTTAGRTRDDADSTQEQDRYPEQHVLAVVDAPHVRDALDALDASGFLESEIQARCDPGAPRPSWTRPPGGAASSTACCGSASGLAS